MAEDDRAAAPAAAQGDASLPQMVLALLRELPGLVSDRVELLSLELRRAGRALAQIVALIVAAAILAVTLWLAAWGVLVGLLVVELGWHWAPVLLGVAALNAAAVWWALQRVRTLAPLLGLPATQRHLTMRGQATATAPSPAAASTAGGSLAQPGSAAP